VVGWGVGVGGGGFGWWTGVGELNGAHFTSVPDEMRKWTKTRQNGNLVEVPELARRRAAEADLFVRPDGAAAPAVAQSMGAVNYTVPGLIGPLTQPPALHG